MAATPTALNLDKWDFGHLKSVIEVLDEKGGFNGTYVNGAYKATIKYVGDEGFHIVTKIERV